MGSHLRHVKEHNQWWGPAPAAATATATATARTVSASAHLHSIHSASSVEHRPVGPVGLPCESRHADLITHTHQHAAHAANTIAPRDSDTVQRFIASRATTALATSQPGHHARTALPQPAKRSTTTTPEGKLAPPCLHPPPSRRTPRLPQPWARHRRFKATPAIRVHRSPSATAVRRQAASRATT